MEKRNTNLNRLKTKNVYKGKYIREGEKQSHIKIKESLTSPDVTGTVLMHFQYQ